MCEPIGEARDEIRPALVYDPDTGEGLRNDIRTNSASQIGLERTTVTMALVRERIARVAGLPVPGLEWTQVLHYGVGQTFDWHVDWLNPDEPGHAPDLAARGQRIATLLVYLNDDYAGGETAFEAGGLHETWDALGNLTTPVWLSRGVVMPHTPAAIAEQIAHRLPHHTLVAWDDLNHFGPMQDPARLADLVRSVNGRVA